MPAVPFEKETSPGAGWGGAAVKRAGFRKIDNDLFHSIIAANLSGSEYKVLLTIIDRTLGFQRESQKISLSEFQAMTGLSRQGVCNSLRQATNKGIIATQKSRGKKTVYALIQDYDRWTTSQSEFTSSLVNKSLPNQSTEVYQTSQVPVSSSHHIKETIKETLKEKVTSNIITSGVREDAPPTAPPTLIRKEIQMGTREIESTIGEATYREKIAAYLGTHGPAAIKTIAQAIGIDRNMVNTALHNGKGKQFIHLTEQRAWGVAGKDTPLTNPHFENSKKGALRDRIVDFLSYSSKPRNLKEISAALGSIDEHYVSMAITQNRQLFNNPGRGYWTLREGDNNT